MKPGAEWIRIASTAVRKANNFWVIKKSIKVQSGHNLVDSVGSAYNDVVVACRCEWKSKTLGYDGVRYGLNVSTVSNLQGKPHTCPYSRLSRLPLLTPQPACKQRNVDLFIGVHCGLIVFCCRVLWRRPDKVIISRRCCRNCCLSDRMYIIETHTTRYLNGYVPPGCNLDRLAVSKVHYYIHCLLG